MSLVITFFDVGFKGKTYKLQGRYFEHFTKSFPGYKDRLQNEKECIAFFAGKELENTHVYLIELIKINYYKDRILFELGKTTKSDLKSLYAARQLKKISSIYGWNDERGIPPIVCLLPENENFLDALKKESKVEQLLEQKEYKAVCMMFAPLSEANKKPQIWNDTDILYALGISCSKMAVSLLTPVSDIKELQKKAKYRRYSIAFLKRGLEIERNCARFATALAYRYYSNVHELFRPGERRDGNLESEIKLANEWLSRAIEMNPQSIKNHYRKGKLIIEKQVPYLLFAKKSFGKGEAKILREIKQVGEEHLVQAIMVYEDIEDKDKKEANKREYAKALFVLGKYYLGDTNLPVHEYYLNKIAGNKPNVSIEKINKLNLESARVYLKGSFAAESDMQLDKALDIKKLAAEEKQWTNSPIKKLYQLGSMYCDTAFVLAAEGSDDKAQRYAKRAIDLLNSAKKISDSLRDRKRNTWYISERIAWTYIHIGKYEVAAKLLRNARAGYVVNTMAIAMLLCGEGGTEAAQKLSVAVRDKHNLAAGLSGVLYAFVRRKLGKESQLDIKSLSEKNKKYANILEVI